MQLLGIQQSQPVELLQLVDSSSMDPQLVLPHGWHTAEVLGRWDADQWLDRPVVFEEVTATMGRPSDIWVAVAAQPVLSQADWVALASGQRLEQRLHLEVSPGHVELGSEPERHSSSQQWLSRWHQTWPRVSLHWS